MKHRIAIAIAFAGIVSGCGGGHHHGPPPTTIDGRAVKGILQNAIVNAYRIDEKGGISASIASTRTDNAGRYQLRLAGAENTPVVVTVTTDADTTMVCENINGCSVGSAEIDQTNIQLKTTKTVGFGRPFNAPSDLELSSLLPYVRANQSNAAHVTVFSDIASTFAADLAAKNKPVDMLNAAQVNGKISDLLQQYSLLEIGDQVIRTEPVDLTNETELKQAIDGEKTSALKLAFLSAALSEIANQDYNGNIVVLVDALRLSYINNGGELLKNKSQAVGHLSVERLINETHQQVAKVTAKYADKKFSFSSIDTEFVAELSKFDDAKSKDIKEIPPEKTESKASDALERYLTNEMLAGKELLQSLRTVGYEIKSNANVVINDIVKDLGGKVEINTVKENFIDLVENGKTLYPHIGNIMVAMLKWMEDNKALGSYDLAKDPDNLLPNDMKITGVVVKSKAYPWSDQIRVVLTDGYVEGLGNVSFEINTLYSYSCFSYYYYCDYSTDRAYLKFTINDGMTTLNITSAELEAQRYYDWSAGVRTPESAWMRNANLEVIFGKPGSSTTTVRGKADIGLKWNYVWPSRSQQIPVVTSFSISNSSYQWGFDKTITSFSGKLSYNNYDSYWSATSDPVTWVKNQAADFNITASFSADIRVPDPNYSYSSSTKRAGVTLSFSNSMYYSDPNNYWWPDYTIREITISYDGEILNLTRATENTYNNNYGDRYRFRNRAGTLMELLIADDGKVVREGKIEYDGKIVARIESTSMGPIIRFTDGTFESF